LGNPEKKTDDFGGSKRRKGRKILISIKVDFKMIRYESWTDHLINEDVLHRVKEQRKKYIYPT
jgi:hypothetical protein